MSGGSVVWRGAFFAASLVAVVVTLEAANRIFDSGSPVDVLRDQRVMPMAIARTQPKTPSMTSSASMDPSATSSLSLSMAPTASSSQSYSNSVAPSRSGSTSSAPSSSSTPSAALTPSRSVAESASRSVADSVSRSVAASPPPPASASVSASSAASVAPVLPFAPVSVDNSPSAAARLNMHLGPDSCGVVKKLEGRVARHDPPYFIPSNCKVWAFTQTQARQCLKGRNVYVMGNSVARGYAYKLVQMLTNGELAGRDAQKQECKKAPMDEDSHPQSCEIGIGDLTTVRYLWRQYLAEEQPWKAAGEGDFCTGSSARDCYARFLSESRENDILLFQQGLAYARYMKFVPTEEGRMPPAAAEELRPQARDFVQLMSQLFHGNAVVAANISPMLPKMYEGVRLMEWPLGTNARAKAIVAELWPIWREAGYGVVDQLTMNYEGYAANETMYDDHVHFPNELSAAAWHYTLSLVCGDPALLPVESERNTTSTL